MFATAVSMTVPVPAARTAARPAAPEAASASSGGRGGRGTCQVSILTDFLSGKIALDFKRQVPELHLDKVSRPVGDELAPSSPSHSSGEPLPAPKSRSQRDPRKTEKKRSRSIGTSG